MSQGSRIKRGTPPRKTQARRKQPALKRRSMLQRALAHVPISEPMLRKIATGAIFTGVAAALTGAAFAAGLPSVAGVAVAEAIGRAGFEVKRVEVTGIDRMEKLTVYAIALDQQSMAMPLVDLETVRQRLLQYGWVQDARVSRRLPDTLLVDIVERKPAAIWQNRQELSLIDDHGVVLEAVALNAMPDLPLVIGPDANLQTTALTRLIGAAPALKPMLAGATWVGGRRWDLRFQSGETLALPQGEKDAARALVRFARMDGVERLLGRGFVRFDMRDPTKFVVRLPKDGGPRAITEGEGKTDGEGAAGAAATTTGAAVGGEQGEG